jgi:hypothetical protein
VTSSAARDAATRYQHDVTPPHHKRFIKAIYRYSRHVKFGAAYWGERKKRIAERLHITADRIAIVDTHKDQPGAVLFEVLLRDAHPVQMRYRTIAYPFLGLEHEWDAVARAVRQLLGAEKKAAAA